ncbi:S41 family peptidase [Blautia glucerasea]|jgi:carboxyl-terminal processing protease|uniref:S41 family peptidase n=1 Tax=Blautia TaxID=572511 RepID=UPI0013709148|nr:MULTISPECIES: S41 family peptidase [Blautia]MCB6368328.1 S41 family peptidase [Blautia glucerasea]MZT64699.1 PDZ domain-containing protein [Blautia sp. BIOML-A1]
MKHGTYVKGVATGVILTVLAGGGIKAVQYCRSDEILSDLAFTQKIKYLENMIDEEYLGEISTDKLEEGVYAGLIYGLGDVYSRYYTKDEYEQESVTTEGSYVGIGVAMQKYTAGGVQIVECYKGSTAEEAGVKVDDVITAINGEDITDTELQDVVSMIKDNEDKDVVLTVQRKGEDTQEITVKVSNVELPSVFGEMLDENTGYIQITEFKGVTVEQYEEIFADLKEQGMERLVVDLRDNPGGLLNVVCDILRDILPEGLIVYTEDKNGNRSEETCDGKNPLDMPLAVLVNGNSASASEIFAGAVKDYGLGTIVGTTTYGKGVVQSIRQLSDGSAVKLTIANYYTPKGNSINKTGIRPDVEVELSPELLNQEEITHEEDNQLQAALNSLNAKN